MAFIEIWQSKREWKRATNKERRRVLLALEELVRKNADRQDGQAGPFLYCTEEACILVWQVRKERAVRLGSDYDRILGNWFSPMMSGIVDGLTAQDYYERLLKGR